MEKQSKERKKARFKKKHDHLYVRKKQKDERDN